MFEFLNKIKFSNSFSFNKNIFAKRSQNQTYVRFCVREDLILMKKRKIHPFNEEKLILIESGRSAVKLREALERSQDTRIKNKEHQAKSEG